MRPPIYPRERRLRSLVRMIARKGLTLAAIGTGFGFPGVFLVTRMSAGLTADVGRPSPSPWCG
ncbi:MAG: hypothetical protein JSV66_04605 [Trueperaceae bacterium]|nr:MAG: hypothetical protein JSV66_04605 [Trueperaceae bacterium]